MRTQVSFTPPGRPAGAPSRGPVRRRHVLYIPGYDREARTRSRSLFVRELIRYGRRFGLTERAVTPVETLDAVPALRWRVRAGREGAWTTETTYDVLRWDDIVERDFGRPMPVCLAWLFLSAVDALVGGLTVRLFRVNWLFAAVTIYPAVMVLLLGLGSAAAGAGAGLALAWAGLPPVPAGTAGLLAAAGVIALLRRPYERWYVWHLLHDWLFNWEHGNGWRRDYEERLGRFAEHLAEVVRTSEADEILVVGHSSGAGMAVETIARALAADPGIGRRGPEIALLTIGTSLPVAAMNPRARTIRQNLVRVMAEPSIPWVEYQAPQDWLNSAGFSPLRDLPLDLPPERCVNPTIRSARFAEITSEATYRTMVKSPFRMHFQFMMANDRPGEYDWVMIVAGPMRLADRIRDPEAAARLAVPA